MDQRLFRIGGHRPHRLINRDVPALARAIVAYIRKQARVDKHQIQNVTCLHFIGGSVDFLVRSDDWAKVVPLLKDGSFDPLVVAVHTPNVRTRTEQFDPAVSDINDPLYQRIVDVLNPLFPISFP